ncbi:MAG: nitrilase-related carbon-nitrogen hydrolase [Clostridia bacterium]
MLAAALEFNETNDGRTGPAHWERLVSNARAQGANALVFPAFTGCLSKDTEEYLEQMRRLSDVYGMILCPGSFYERSNGETFHSSVVFSSGELLLKQRQIYLSGREREEGFQRGTTVGTVDVGGFRLGLLLPSDVYHPQVSRELALLGVDVVFIPGGYARERSCTSAIRGVWSQVQQNLFFAVESGFNGMMGNTLYAAESMIHAPLLMTGGDDGILARSGGEKEMVLARLDKEKRKDAVDRFNVIGRLNPRFYLAEGLFRGTGGTRASGHLRISMVQRSIRPVRSIRGYRRMAEAFVAQASGEGSKLVAFPEYNFLDLYGLLPGFRILEKHLGAGKGGSGAGEGFPGAVFRLPANLFRRIMDRTFSRLAKKYGMYVYAGTHVLLERKKMFNAGSLYDPGGKCIGTQKKLHLTDFEAGCGFFEGDRLEVYQIEGIKLAIPICMDATYFETFSVAVKKGCTLVVVPIANNEEYSVTRSCRGVYTRTGETMVYGAKSALTGTIAGMRFTGKAGVFSPFVHDSGVLALAGEHEGDELVTADLDMELLLKEEKAVEYGMDKNASYEAGYEQRVYGGR